jgi:hypothetical protein
MAFAVRVLNEDGDPVRTVPIVAMFNGANRIEGVTNFNGEVVYDPCPGVNVHLTVNGVHRGVHVCYDGTEVEIEI